MSYHGLVLNTPDASSHEGIQQKNMFLGGNHSDQATSLFFLTSEYKNIISVYREDKIAAQRLQPSVPCHLHCLRASLIPKL